MDAPGYSAGKTQLARSGSTAQASNHNRKAPPVLEASNAETQELVLITAAKISKELRTSQELRYAERSALDTAPGAQPSAYVSVRLEPHRSRARGRASRSARACGRSGRRRCESAAPASVRAEAGHAPATVARAKRLLARWRLVVYGRCTDYLQKVYDAMSNLYLCNGALGLLDKMWWLSATNQINAS
eukprot:6179854-Pleurochrysis_carterae.AAC.4